MASDYEFKHMRVTFTGSMFGVEIWSTGLLLGVAGADVTEVPGGIAEELSEHWETFFTNANHAISNSYRYQQCKVALINTNGTTDVENIDYWTADSLVTGGQGGTPLPPQITLAATMTSELQRGLAAKGRMFLPGVSSGVDGSTGRLGAAFTNTLNTGFKNFLDAINADPDIPASVVLASKGHKTTTLDTNGQPVYENGRQALVTGCRIGNVYDTQRRRRNDLPEAYDAKVLA